MGGCRQSVHGSCSPSLSVSHLSPRCWQLEQQPGSVPATMLTHPTPAVAFLSDTNSFWIPATVCASVPLSVYLLRGQEIFILFVCFLFFFLRFLIWIKSCKYKRPVIVLLVWNIRAEHNEQFILNEPNLWHWRDQQWSWHTVQFPVMLLWDCFDVLSVKLTQLMAENSSTLNIGAVVTSLQSGLWFTGLSSLTWNLQWLQTFFSSIFLMQTFCSSPAEPPCEWGTCCIRSNLHMQFAVKCMITLLCSV